MSISNSTRIFFLFLLLICTSNVVNAQEGELELDSTVEYAFGQELRFYINVTNAADIEKITLSLRPNLSKNLYILDVPFEMGETISVTHKIDVHDINLMPYGQVNYSLEFQTSDGMFKTIEEDFSYEDDRFGWQQMTRKGITAHWTGGGPDFGQDVLNLVDGALTNLANVLPLEQINPFNVYVYPSSADLRSGLRLAGIGGEDSSHPELGVILATAVNPQSAITELGQSLPYELTKLLLYRVSGERFEYIPWWLAEGLATSVQVTPHPRYQQLLDDAIVTGETIPIHQLCQKTERISDRDLLASAQSSSLVNFIIQRYGNETIVDLISAYVIGDNCEAGVKHVMDMSLIELDNAWLNSQKKPSAMSQFFNDFGLWLLLLLAGTALMTLLILQTWQGRRSG